MYKIDLHTHSIASHDGGLKAGDYKDALSSGNLNYVAVTDHNTIDFALKLNSEIGEQVIVGEEINTKEGEIIGLYLSECIPADLDLKDAVKRVKAQGGLVYIPHPFETVRSGLSRESLNEIVKEVDIVEIYNGRAIFQNKSKLALEWSSLHNAAGASSSDAHGRRGWLKTYSILTSRPNKNNLVELIGPARHRNDKVGVIGIMYPKLNKIKKIRRR